MAQITIDVPDDEIRLVRLLLSAEARRWVMALEASKSATTHPDARWRLDQRISTFRNIVTQLENEGQDKCGMRSQPLGESSSESSSSGSSSSPQPRIIDPSSWPIPGGHWHPGDES